MCAYENSDGSNYLLTQFSPTLLLWIRFSFGVFLVQIEVMPQSINMFLLIPICLMAYISSGETLNCSEDVRHTQIQNLTFPGGYLGPSVNISWGLKEFGDVLPCVSITKNRKIQKSRLTSDNPLT